MQLYPSPALRPFVKHYLYLKNTDIHNLRFFPDGNTGLVFVLDKNPFADLPSFFFMDQETNLQILVRPDP